MGTRLFIGNLPWKAREDDLREWIEEKGFAPESVEVVLEPGGERSRGFGFASFATEAAAAEALRELDGEDLDGRVLRVSEATSRNRGGDRRGGGRRGESPRDEWED